MFQKLSEANRARQFEWDEGQKFTPMFFSNALAGEVGEVCNIVKKHERTRLGLKGKTATIEQLADEIADVIIYAEILAATCNIDLGEAVKSKFNKTSEELGFKTRLE